jgi:hypothetical protein
MVAHTIASEQHGKKESEERKSNPPKRIKKNPTRYPPVSCPFRRGNEQQYTTPIADSLSPGGHRSKQARSINERATERKRLPPPQADPRGEPATCRGDTAQTREGEQRRRLVAWSGRGARSGATARARVQAPPTGHRQLSPAAHPPTALLLTCSGAAAARTEQRRHAATGMASLLAPIRWLAIECAGTERSPSAPPRVAGLSPPGKVLSPHFSTHYRKLCCNPTNPCNNCLTTIAASVQC